MVLKSPLLVALVGAQLATFIVQFFQKTELQVSTVVLVVGWTSKRPFFIDTGEALSLHIYCLGLGEQSFKPLSQETELLSGYDNFSGKVVLKRPFINNTWDAMAYHIHCSGLL